MLPRNRTSALRETSESLGWNSANTFSWVSSVSRVFRSQPYSPRQKNVLPPGTCSMSPVSTPRARSTSYSASPKSSPTGPTTWTVSKNAAASAKWTAEPPSIRSRLPNGVLTASNAIDPTTVTDMRRASVAARRTRSPRGSNSGSRTTSPPDPRPEDVDLDRRADLDLRREIGVGDRALDRVAVAAARDPAADALSDPHRLVAEHDRARVLEHQAPQPPARLGPGQRVRADERLVRAHAEPEPALERSLVGRDVGRPHAVALLEPQRVDRPVAAGHACPSGSPASHSVRHRPGAVLGRAVELPAAPPRRT